MISRRALLLTVAIAAAAALPAASRVASAQDYPSRAIRLITPFPAGPADLVIRLYAEKISEDWNQPAIVDNRPGATGAIGTQAVVQAQPDGYTLLFTVDLPISMAPNLMKVPYDPQRDLVPIAAVVESSGVLVVNASSGIRTLADLDRRRQGQAGRADLLVGRHRLAGASVRRDDQAAGRHRHDPRPLQGRRPGHERGARRGRDHVLRPDRAVAPVHQGGEVQCARRLRAEVVGALAGRGRRCRSPFRGSSSPTGTASWRPRKRPPTFARSCVRSSRRSTPIRSCSRSSGRSAWSRIGSRAPTWPSGSPKSSSSTGISSRQPTSDAG